jgi:predicted nucleic acid-binding protein
MICSSSLADDLTPLVLDTSVLINLHACSLGEEILTAIPNSIAVPDFVIRELGHESSRNNGAYEFIERLLERRKVRPVSLDGHGWDVFEKLTTHSPSLGDGEAATIAIATSSAHLPVIDDAKGRKCTAALIGEIAAAWSLDLLVHPRVQQGLENDGYIEAVFLALREGRMRIDEKRCDAIVALIGMERALQCPSLPGFKTRCEHWKRAIAR